MDGSTPGLLWMTCNLRTDPDHVTVHLREKMIADTCCCIASMQ